MSEQYFHSSSGNQKYLVDQSVPIREGKQKQTYCVRFNHQRYAAKIYRCFEDWDDEINPIDQKQAAISEYKNYQEFLKSPLKPYVPRPIDLLLQDGKIVGLAIEWRNGGPINDFYPNLVIPQDLLNALELSLFQLPSNMFLDLDIISDANLCYNPSDHKLWLAELERGTYPDHESFKQLVREKIRLLRSDYANK